MLANEDKQKRSESERNVPNKLWFSVYTSTLQQKIFTLEGVSQKK